MDCFEGCYAVVRTFVATEASERVVSTYDRGLGMKLPRISHSNRELPVLLVPFNFESGKTRKNYRQTYGPYLRATRV